MKKYFVSLFMLLFFTVSLTEGVFAENLKNDLVIESGIVSNEVEEYAANNFQKKLFANLLVDAAKNEKELGEYTLGKGINMLNSYENSSERTILFPVYFENKVVYTYLVKKASDGSVSDNLSDALVDEFNKLFDSIDDKTKIKFIQKDYDILYSLNDSENYQTFFKSNLKRTDNDGETISEEISDVENTVDIEQTELIDTDEVIIIEDSSEELLSKTNSSLSRSFSNGYNYSMVDLKVYQNQSQVNNGQNEWCMGFALAGIVNSMRNKNEVQAADVMKYVYPNNTGEKYYMNGGINSLDVINYSKNKLGMNPYYVDRPLTLSEIRNELNVGSPAFVFSKVNYDTNSKYDYHALVVHGWVNIEPGLDVLYIWNPWWSHTSCVDGGVKSPVLPFVGGQFTWQTSIRGFR